MARKDELISTLWDLYKDVNGIRPRGINYASWSEEKLDREVEHLSRMLEITLVEEREVEAANAAKFEARITAMMQDHNITRASALRWIHDAEGTNGNDDGLEFELGLPYGYFRQAA